MAMEGGRLGLRVTMAVLICVVAFYVGRPLYWKLSATLQEVREKNYAGQAMKDGFSNFVQKAQKSVGWFHDEADAVVIDKSSGKANNRRRANFRKLAHFVDSESEGVY